MARPRTGEIIGKGKDRQTGRPKWQLRASVTVITDEAEDDPHSMVRLPQYRKVSRTFVGTKSEAEVEMARFLVEVRREQSQSQVNRTANVRTMTLNELIELFLENHDVEVLTLRGYRNKYDLYIKPSKLGSMRANRITGLDVTKFYNALYASGKSHGSLGIVRAVISGAYRWAMSQEMGLPTNPTVVAVFPKNRDVPTTEGAPEPDLVAEVLRVAEEAMPDLKTPFAVAALTGLRRGELAALRMSAIKTVGGSTYLYITQAVVTLGRTEKPKRNYIQAGEHTFLKPTKGHAARHFRLDESTYAALQGQIDWIRVRASAASVELVKDPFLFSLAPDCAVPPRPDYLTGKWTDLRSIPGSDNMRLHDLRHFCGTQLGSAGASPTTIKERLGHRSEATTERYKKMTYEDDKKAAQTLGDIGRRLKGD